MLSFKNIYIYIKRNKENKSGIFHHPFHVVYFSSSPVLPQVSDQCLSKSRMLCDIEISLTAKTRLPVRFRNFLEDFNALHIVTSLGGKKRLYDRSD